MVVTKLKVDMVKDVDAFMTVVEVPLNLFPIEFDGVLNE